jgi:hypothetical protein
MAKALMVSASKARGMAALRSGKGMAHSVGTRLFQKNLLNSETVLRRDQE